ncbi:MAG: glycoside hydrolase family 78 protein [Lachnospiraceae bacterium]|nr:glycoside hydrolase family 78 protein [Lachnospiraceae bacterium]
MRYLINNIWVEYQDEMPVIEVENPRISWTLDSEERGVEQRAYQIKVYCKWSHTKPSDREKMVWDSGRVRSGQMTNVCYRGVPLLAESFYEVYLQVWDQEEQEQAITGYFETGLMCGKKQYMDWEGAKWIGANQPLQVYADYLSVFQAEAAIQFEEAGTEAGIILGADDPRLMDAGQNIYGIERKTGESFVRFTLDVSDFTNGAEIPHAFVKAYRVGYTDEDVEQNINPLYEVEVPTGIIHQKNYLDKHTLILKAVYGVFEIYLDGEDEEHHVTKLDKPDPMPWDSAAWNLNPWGCGGDYIAFPNLCKIAAYEKEKDTAKIHINIKNYRKPNNALYSGEPVKNQLIDITAGTNPVLRKDFSIQKKQVQFARIYATARGIYELYLNGKRVGKDYFAPGLSQYDKTQYYQVYDITDMIEEQNTLGAVLSEGWWSGAISFSGSNWNFFGDQLSFLGKVVIGYEDGTQEVLVTDPKSWMTTDAGQVNYASFFQGQITDLTKVGYEELISDKGRDAAQWMPAVEIQTSENDAFVGEYIAGLDGGTLAIDYEKVTYCAQPDKGVRESSLLGAVSVTEPRKGYYVYDMGQNLAGFPRIQIQGKAGQKIQIRYAEMLYPMKAEYGLNQGMLMLENIRGAMAKDIFTLRDGRQELCPTFTSHGYRYLEITGIDEALPLEDVCGVAISSVPKQGADFSCSSDEITRLYKNISWSLQDNFISIPTDCPQRNERMGWSGDLSVFARTATYMSACQPFLRRHLQALRDTQRTDGRIADIAPLAGGFGGVLWGSVAITVPWEMYLQYGDFAILEEQYDSMCQYMSFLETKIDKDGYLKEGPLGDWLGVENYKTEPEFLWMTYYLYDLKIVRNVAELLDHMDDAAKWNACYQEHEKWYLDTYFDRQTGKTLYSSEQAAFSVNNIMNPFGKRTDQIEQTAQGRYLMDSQASYAVPLGLKVLNGNLKRLCEKNLKETCIRKNQTENGTIVEPYALMTGFIGTSWISQALSEAGYDQTAWKMLKNENYPSWLYPVKQGATTIWERLDSYTHKNGFGGNNSMNSFNHYSFGAVGTWMLAYAGGVRRGLEPGTYRIAPIPDTEHEVTWVNSRVETVQGTYRCKWNWDEQEEAYYYEILIPAGHHSEIELMVGPGYQIEGINDYTNSEQYLTGIVYTDQRVRMNAASGSYHFVVRSVEQ